MNKIIPIIFGISFLVSGLYAQFGGQAGNFNIESDLYSGNPIDVDDWFQGIGGIGIIDQNRTLQYRPRLAANQNISFVLDMAAAPYSNPNGQLLYDAKYIRDYIKFSGNNIDQNTFRGGKNGDDPLSWSTRPGNVSGANDIVDAYVHMRRDGASLSDDLWMFLAITTLENNGDHYFDFEMFNSDLIHTGSGFINSGPEEGHTAWQFDSSGNVIETGDLIVGFAVSGGGITSFEVRLWVSKSDYNTITPSDFSWGTEIDGSNNGSLYGYAKIEIQSSDFYATTNSSSTTAPPWGTHSNGVYSTTYPANGFAEVGINLTAIGLNNFINEEGANPCESPFSKIMTKSRSSQSFTSALIDFTEPIDFAASSLIDSSAIEFVELTTCEEYGVLVPEFPLLGAYYEWSTVDGQFEDGSQLFIGDSAVVVLPGTYTLSAAPLPECERSTFDLVVDADPCAVRDDFPVAFNSFNNRLDVLPNDSDLDNDLDLSSLDNNGLLTTASGILSIDTIDHVFIYTPSFDYVGLDSFEYVICDQAAQCDTALAIINVIGEFCNNGVDDDNDGLVDCEDPDCGLISLDALEVSECVDDPLMDVATITATISWDPSYTENDTIKVSVYRKSRYVDIASMSSPVQLEFQVPADASFDNQIRIEWLSDRNICEAESSYEAPEACSQDSIPCSILYIGGFVDAESKSWDWGMIEYLNAINGNGMIEIALSDQDGLGHQLYDPYDSIQLLDLNLNDYELIIIGPTTSGSMSSDLINELASIRRSVLNMNSDINQVLGLSSIDIPRQQNLVYLSDASTTEVYDFNLKASQPTLVIGSDAYSNADQYLWTDPGAMTMGTNAVHIVYPENEGLTNIGDIHGHRVFFGYHMQNVIEESFIDEYNETEKYFSPVQNLTAEGKRLFDQALLSASVCSSLCPIATTNPHILYSRRR